MTVALAPVTGRVVALADVPDAVFAGQLVGAGVAIEPSAPPAGGRLVDVVSPVDGEIVKLHPHAFALEFARSAFRHSCVVCEWDPELAASAEGRPPPVA